MSNSLALKLAKVMQEVKYIQKRGHNKFHNYKYATEADVNEKVRECLAEKNVIMLPSMKSHSIRETKTAKGDTEYIVCVDMDFTFIDGESGEQLTITMSGEGQDRGDKAIYKAISGAQKYALMKVFMIPTGDDPEGDETVDERNHKESNVRNSGSKVQRSGLANKGQRNAIGNMIKNLGLEGDALTDALKSCGIHDSAAMTYEQADKLIGVLANMKPEAVNA